MDTDSRKPSEDVLSFLQRGLSFSPDSPTRDPDWRYQLVLYLDAVQGRDVLLQWADEIVREAVAFLQERENLYQLPEVGRLHDDDKDFYCGLVMSRVNPHLSSAFSLRTAAKNELEVDLQCAILARMSEAEICQEFSISPETLRYYKQLFYDVDDRLDSPYYIVHYAVFFKADSYNFLKYANLCRFFSYWCGADMFRYLRCKSVPRLTVENQRLSAESLDFIHGSSREMAAIRRWAYLHTPEERKILSRILSGVNASLEKIRESRESAPPVVKALLQELQMQLPTPEELGSINDYILQEDILKSRDEA